jgi:hypothetical protein
MTHAWYLQLNVQRFILNDAHRINLDITCVQFPSNHDTLLEKSWKSFNVETALKFVSV